MSRRHRGTLFGLHAVIAGRRLVRVSILAGFAIASVAAFGETAVRQPPSTYRVAPGAAVSLVDAIQIALETDPRMSAAGYAEQAAEHELRSAEALKLPRIDIHSTLRQSNNDERYRPLGDLGLLLSDIHNDNSAVTGAVMEVPVYHGDRLAILPRIARRVKETAQQKRRAAAQDVILELVDVYLDVLVARKELQVLEAQAARLDVDLRGAREQMVTDALAASRAVGLELALAEVERLEITHRGTHDHALERLGQLVRAAPGEPPAVDPEFVMRELETPVGEMMKVALADSPDVRILELAVETAEQEIGLAASQEKLQVNFRADYFDNRPLERNQARDDVWTVALFSSWNLFDGGHVDEEKERSRQKLREAKARLAEGIQKVDLQIHRAYGNLTAARKLLERQNQNVDLARRTLDRINEKYRVNVMPRTDLLDARTNLLRALVNRDRVSAEVLESRATLFRLMGRLEAELFQSAGPIALRRGARL